MKVKSTASINVGTGSPKEISKAMEENKIPDGASVVKVGSDSQWVNGPSTSGYIGFVTLEFEWTSNR